MAVPRIMTFNSLSFHHLWTWQTPHCHMCFQHVGLPLNQQVDGYLCTAVSIDNYVAKIYVIHRLSFLAGERQARVAVSQQFCRRYFILCNIYRILFNNKMFQANVEVISRSTCNNLSAYRGRITNQMVCMGVLAGGIDTCQVSNLWEVEYSITFKSTYSPQGDSGGPAVTQNGDNWEVTGVTSWGSGCAFQNRPGVYANAYGKQWNGTFTMISKNATSLISVVRDWIASTTGSSECPRS